MKRKPQSQLPSNPDSFVRVVAGKLSANEMEELMPKIVYYAKGNNSLYVRTALMNYKPKKEDFK